LQLFRETNLKIRGAHPSINKIVSNVDNHSGIITAIIECEHPNNALYKFEGNLKVSTSVIPLEAKQLLLRVSTLLKDIPFSIPQEAN
jgi:hypothetical protein